MKPEPFKVCPTCGKVWKALDEFLADPELELMGYQVHFEDLTGGLFIFIHHHENCGTTLAVPVGQFTSLSERPILTPRGQPVEHCPSLCVREGALTPCPNECECVWVREVMQAIRERKKRTT